VRKTLHQILLAMVAGVLIYFAYAVWSGLGKIGHSLAHFSVPSFGLACVLAFANYWFRFFKWEFYLARLGIRGIPKVDSFLTFLSGFVLTVTPGKVGEVFKSVVLFEVYDVPFARTAPIVVAERVTDLIGIVVLIVLGSLGFPGGLVWAGVGGALVLALLAVVASPRLSHAILGLVQRLGGPLGRIAPKLRESYESLATLVQVRNLVVPTLLSIVAWSFECLSLWVILRGFGEETGLPLASFFYATSTLIGALVLVPGGLGVTEGALKEQLERLGHVSEGTSTAAMMLVRFATLWFAVLVGFVALALLRRRHPGLLAAAERDMPREAR
jgi:uncharacterized protein (TIRG00374 family)